MAFRNLTTEETAALEQNGCWCGDWSQVRVKEGFRTHNIRNVQFSGTVRIGLLQKQFVAQEGVPKTAGLYNATIHNCTIGDDVYINQIRNQLANYDIDEDVVIENVDALSVNGDSSFGNGVRVAVLNETGGREIAMYNELSAHTAYLMAFYRHRPALIQHMMEMVDAYAKSVRSNRRSEERRVGKECRSRWATCQ